MRVENYTFNEFAALKEGEELDRLVFALRYSDELNQPKDVYNVGSFFERPFGWVKDVQHEMNTNGLQWLRFLELLQEAGQNEPANLFLFDLRKEMLYFAKQVEAINAAEATLGAKPTADELMADSSAIAKMGAFVQFSELAGGDVTQIEAIKQVQYGVCFAELKLRKERAEYQRRLTKIMSRK